MQFVPRGERVVILVFVEPKVTAGGLYIPDSAEDKPSRGKVIHAGETSLKAGQTVLFSKFAGTVVHDGSQDLLIVSQRDIMAVIEGA